MSLGARTMTMTPKLKSTRLELEDNTLLKMLKKYKDNPCLWDTKHRYYHNKPVKSVAWDSLLELWRKCEPRATQHDVKVKIFHMRTNYTRQRRKVESHASAGIEYKPTLWYYKHMNFLSGKKNSDDEDDDDSDSDHNDETPYVQPPRGKKRTASTPINQEQEPETSIDASAAAFGRSVGAQLHQLSKMQRCVAEKLISDVIYHAKMDQLSMDASISVKGTVDDANFQVNAVIPKSGPSWYDTALDTGLGQEPSSSTFITNTNEDLTQKEIDETESAVNFIKFETGDNENYVFHNDLDEQSSTIDIDIKEELL